MRDCLCPVAAASRRRARLPLNHGWSSPARWLVALLLVALSEHVVGGAGRLSLRLRERAILSAARATPLAVLKGANGVPGS